MSQRAVRRAGAVLATAAIVGAVPVLAPAAADAASKPKVTISSVQIGYQSKSGATGTYKAGSPVTVGTYVSPSKTGEDVTWLLQRFVSGTWFDDQTGTYQLDSNSSYGLQLTLPDGSLYRSRWVFDGDDSYAKTTSAWQNIQYKGKQTDLKQAKVSLTAKGGKKDGKYESCSKHDGDCDVTATVSPNRSGKKVKLTAEELVKGKWKPLASTALDLNGNSKATTQAHGQVGHKYRLYAAYLGDNRTLRGASPMVYIEFTK